MKEFIKDIFRQLFGSAKPRAGKLVFSRHAYNKMIDYGLDVTTITDTFRYGERKADTMIVRKYPHYHVGIYVKLQNNIHEEDTCYVIITVWKQVNW